MKAKQREREIRERRLAIAVGKDTSIISDSAFGEVVTDCNPPITNKCSAAQSQVEYWLLAIGVVAVVVGAYFTFGGS